MFYHTKFVNRFEVNEGTNKKREQQVRMDFLVMNEAMEMRKIKHGWRRPIWTRRKKAAKFTVKNSRHCRFSEKSLTDHHYHQQQQQQSFIGTYHLE